MHTNKQTLILLRGGGDLATGVALRLHRAGLKVVITELAQPLTVRRTVSFAETVYEGEHTVEEVTARLVKPDGLFSVMQADEIPVLVDPNADILLSSFFFPVLIDGRLLKTTPPPLSKDLPLHIGLGPGFHAGLNCHAAIETRRSHTLVPSPGPSSSAVDQRRTAPSSRTSSGSIRPLRAGSWVIIESRGGARGKWCEVHEFTGRTRPIESRARRGRVIRA